jgi:hypothetical protein
MDYSSSINHLKKSMNPIVDSAQKMKLYKTESFSDEIYIERDKTLWPAWTWIIEMKEITVENPEDVTRYINRYKKSIGIGK